MVERGHRWWRKPYFAVAAGLAVCAVAVGAYLLTRPPLGQVPSASPAASGGSTADDDAASLLPVPSASPSGGDAGQEERSEDEDGKAEEEGADAKPRKAAGGPGGGAGEGDDYPGTAGSSGGDGGTPDPTPTKPATRTATPPWNSQCTYYSGTRLTVYGDSGKRVVQVQCMLTERGYGVGRSGVDGQFGKDTMSAVRRFQSDRGLDVDGDVGAKTWAALRSST